jgi:hypothetical protein
VATETVMHVPSGPDDQVHTSGQTQNPAALPAGARGDWPRTNRLLPWALAGFIAMLYLIPFDATTLPVGLPVDSKLDRLIMPVLAVMWLVSVFERRPGSPVMRRGPMNVAIFVFVTVAAASVALNLPELAHSNELILSIKKLSLLGSYVLFFFIVMTSVRPREVNAFLALVLGLAAITALGTVYEYRYGTNLFYEFAMHALPIGNVRLPYRPSGEFARRLVIGPTGHGLADATLVFMALPIAVIWLVRAPTAGRKLLLLSLIALLVAGGLATQRKTAVVLPFVAIAVLLAYRPRVFARYWPAVVIVVLVVRVVAPGAVSGIAYQFGIVGTSSSTAERVQDYAAVWPDITTHLVFGRGFGSYDPDKYRFLDNEVLGTVVEVGIVGAIAYVALILSSVMSVHRLARHRDFARAGPAVGIAAASSAFLAANFLYDAFGFRHGPYVFMLFAGLGVVLAADETAP